MKPYGVKKQDDNCCMGHAKFPRKRAMETKSWGKTKNSRIRKPAKTRARRFKIEDKD